MAASSARSDLSTDFGENVPTGGKHYRAYVGPPTHYDKVAASQFTLLTLLGLREFHTLLDVGCGSLRSGRLSIMYLRPGNYYGIEPAIWALEDGKEANLGSELISKKQPTFSSDANYTLTIFDRQFDYILIHSVFCHAPAVQIARCLQQARQVMHPKSLLIATYLEGEIDRDGDDWRYPSYDSNNNLIPPLDQDGNPKYGLSMRFRRATIDKMVHEAGLSCVFLDWPELCGQQTFVAMDPSNSIDVNSMLHASEFSSESLLCSELETRTGKRPISYKEYLVEQLRSTQKF